jgi:large subunit ribosomal protein L6
MSRIGKSPISIPAGVSIDVEDGNLVKVKGPKGELSQKIHQDLKVTIEDSTLKVERPTDEQQHKEVHGLYRTLINNMVVGVSQGYTKELELVGVGYRTSNTGNLLEVIVGYSHPILFAVPDEVTVETKTEKGSNPKIILQSADKQLLGQIAAKIRSFRKPEPYKGKGIKYSGEIIRRKAGKTAKK